jgi:Ni,Fe-hydrogenase III small subunit
MNPFHDLARFGFAITASPRHADVLLVTGPVTRAMRGPLEAAYAAMSEPRTVAAVGDCALGRFSYGTPETCIGGVEDVLPIGLRIPGCPPDPETIARHLLEHRAERARSGSPRNG